MSGYQFAHMELWSAKPSNGNGSEPHAKKKNGERKWSAQEILDEAERIASASAHVIPGRPGPQILPRAASSFGDMRQMQEKASQVEESYMGGARGKKRTPRTRKLRVDAASLYASVFSLPVKSEAALADPELRQSSLDVLEQALDWECDRIGKVGGRVLAGVVHWDEEHLHLHVFAIDPVRGRVDHLHPGRAAKAAINMSAGPKSKARGKKANAAYCDAMRAWQDELHGEVFAASGLLRYGPGRHRWTRKEYGRAKALAADIASRETRLSDLEAWEGAQERRQDEQDARESDLDDRQTKIEEREAAAEEKVARAAAAQADALGLRNALEIGSRAVAVRQLDYREPTEEREEGLDFGPAAPRSKTQKKRLMDVVRPAYDFVLDLARKAFNLRRREAKSKRKEAEIRSAAAALAREQQERGQPLSETLTNLTEGQPVPLDREAFPDALFVAGGADAEERRELQGRLDTMSNTEVRRTWVATWQSESICDERPNLAADLARGRRILEHNARQRGYDLESGKHDPDTAEDPSRARLHVDAEPDPIRIVRKNHARVRTRA